MKPVKAKTKTRKANGKFARMKFPSKDAVNVINPDLSSLRQPIDISISTLRHVTKLMENGSDEVKAILAHECDLVYECRICRSLFRSLANFVSHKRVYCKERFNISFSHSALTDYHMLFTADSSLNKPESICNENNSNDRILRSQVSREEQKTDLCAAIATEQNKQTASCREKSEEIFLESVKSNPCAVYQTVKPVSPIAEDVDLMKTQVTEIKEMLSRNTAVLDPNGQVIEAKPANTLDNTLEICSSEDDDETLASILPIKDFICNICSAKFTTKKTLAVHTKSMHTSHHMCYPCPCCPSTFTNIWSVYRHLFKVHRKSHDQVRKLRSQIQEKAVRKGTTLAEDLKRQRTMKALENNNALRADGTQEWMDHLESNVEFQCCGGCGKHFDRKAALSSHSQYCQRRIAACNEATSKPKKSNKFASESPKPSDLKTNGTEEDSRKERAPIDTVESSLSSETSDSNDINIRVEAVTSLSEAAWNMLENDQLALGNGENNNIIVSSTSISTESSARSEATRSESSPASSPSEPPEVVFTHVTKPKANTVIEGSRKRKMSTRRIIKQPIHNPESERGKASMEQKMASITNLQKLDCLLCTRKFTSVTNLRRHAAMHIGWYRFRCKLCDYKCFVTCDCVTHCNKVHNAQNDRGVICQMMTQIPDSEYKYDQEIVLDVSALEQESSTPEVIEIDINTEKESAPQKEESVSTETTKNSSTVVENEVIEINEPVKVNGLVGSNTTTSEASVIEGATGERSTSGRKTPRWNADPDLRRMIMEVIFGTSDVDMGGSEETTGGKESNNESRTQDKEDQRSISRASSDCSSTNSMGQDSLKLPRPAVVP